MQERDTARDCIKKVFGDVNITNVNTDEYPIRVKITAKLGGKGQDLTVWEGRQQSLFRKNGKERMETVKKIVELLEELKEEV